MLPTTLPRTGPSNGGVNAATVAVPLQKGPAYTCFRCGLPTRGLTPWAVSFTSPSPLDAWAGHIGYLKLTCACRAASRVARLGGWITPLAFHTDLDAFPSWEAFTDANVQAVRKAVAAIAAAVPAEDLALDIPTRIVHHVLAGRLAPAAAVAEINALLKAGAP
jgi:hypothetical protein